MTMMFLLIILGATARQAPQGLLPLLSDWTDFNPSNQHSGHQYVINPARSTAVLYLWDWAIDSCAILGSPIIGAVLGAFIYRFIGED